MHVKLCSRGAGAGAGFGVGGGGEGGGIGDGEGIFDTLHQATSQLTLQPAALSDVWCSRQQDSQATLPPVVRASPQVLFIATQHGDGCRVE